MTNSLQKQFEIDIGQINWNDSLSVPDLVNVILSSAEAASASDIHLRPTGTSLEMLWRIDGVLQTIFEFPASIAPNIIARLKVLADLLTYITDSPQEGRIRASNESIETRVSTFPTMHGEKAVVRLFIGSGKYQTLDDLNLPKETSQSLQKLIRETSGCIILSGPAGSGKTTTIYALLRELLSTYSSSRSLVTLEDPIEVDIPGVDQTQVNNASAFDMSTGLRSLMRQDPEVIVVGEIRDRDTAETVFQASMTGHLVLSTFHAGSAAQCFSRLSDMDIETYLLKGSILGVVSQRLIRSLCSCSKESEVEADKCGLVTAASVRIPVGCSKCRATGYLGRSIISEILLPDEHNLTSSILNERDATALEKHAVESGMISLKAQAVTMINNGKTSPEEIIRVLGVNRFQA